MEQLLQLDDIHCTYGSHCVAEALSLTIESGQLVCLLGPSGCGKTTVLRAIAGFEPVCGGEIRLGSRTISHAGYTLPPEKRGVGMVFQDYALFPNLSVEQNITFGLQRHSKKEKTTVSDQLLELVGLAGEGKRYPHELSGGQQQRVSLARALAPEPPLLLLDEPFSNLDVELRERLAIEVRDILKAQGTAALFVTHDQQEAFVMGEQVAVMHEGRILQCDTPYRLYHEPATPFVADFIGQGVMLPGTILANGQVETELGTLNGKMPKQCREGCQVKVLLRPDDVIHDDDSPLQLPIKAKAFRGASYLYTLALPSGNELLCMVQSHHNHPVGERIGIRLEVDDLVLFPADEV